VVVCATLFLYLIKHPNQGISYTATTNTQTGLQCPPRMYDDEDKAGQQQTTNRFIMESNGSMEFLVDTSLQRALHLTILLQSDQLKRLTQVE